MITDNKQEYFKLCLALFRFRFLQLYRFSCSSIIYLQTIIMHIALILTLSLLAAAQAKPARPESLPKIVWTYQENIDGNLVHSLCLHRMRSMLEDSRWVLEVLTPTNIFIYLHQHEEYKLMLKNHHKYLTFIEQVQIAKLLILQEYGGIWIDPDIILLEPVDWIHYLSSQSDIETYQNPAYEMVIFSTQNVETANYKQLQHSSIEQTDQSILSLNLGIILVLKQSTIMSKWVAGLSKQLQNIQFDASDQQDIERKVKDLSKIILTEILLRKEKEEGNKFKQYLIWKLPQNDYFYDFKSFANTENRYALADFYIKYPLTTIAQQFQNSKHFISLSQVSSQLNEILNPNISRLSYLSQSQYYNCPKKVKCAHYLQEQSIIYTLLIEGTRFQKLIQNLVNKDEKITNQCASSLLSQRFMQVITAITFTACIIFIYIAFILQKLCIQLLWVKAKIFLKPRITLMFKILKTVKNIIQYSSNNGYGQ